MSKAGEVAATVGVAVGTALLVAGAVTVAVLCPEAIPQTPPKRVVVVKPGVPVAPIPGAPAYKVPTGPTEIYTFRGNLNNCTVVRNVPKNCCSIYVDGKIYPILQQQNGTRYFNVGDRLVKVY